MKKFLAGLAVLETFAVAAGPVGAQLFQNGPYYANPSWDQQIPAAARFIVLSNWNNEAVLDRETGLVWQRTPDTALYLWADAIHQCRITIIGNRRGWRLPSYEELTSLLDPAQSFPALPAGHPFQDIGPQDDFWSATTLEGKAGNAWTVNVFNAVTTESLEKYFPTRYWCVRGGSSVSNPTN